MVERLSETLHVEGDTAVFQIEYLERVPQSRATFSRMLGSLERLARAHGATRMRIETPIANLKLNSVFVHQLGPPQPGDDPKFGDTWTVRSHSHSAA